MPLAFSKYHGLGNDFIVVDDPGASIDAEGAVRLCDRHFGVGADGVLLVSPSSSANATLLILNADGSRPEMCGNGLRCVALHLSRRSPEPVSELRVKTDAGVLACRLTTRGSQCWVSTSLGVARPLGTLEVSGCSFDRVSIGNPHAVAFNGEQDVAAIDALAPRVSASISGGANIEFARLVGQELAVIVWERGVGRTLACGTGAGATAVAAVQRGLVPYETPVSVRLPGGVLEVTVQRNLDVILSGPAEHVFDGVLSL